MEEIPKPLHVYVVEDSPIVRRLLASTIEAAGAELVGSSGSARVAIADVTLLQPDLVLIDISLDSGNGFEVLRALQEGNLAPSAIKVVLTNHANADCQNLSVRLGAHSFFDKASETSQVLALMNALAAEKRRRGNLARDPDHHEGNHSRN